MERAARIAERAEAFVRETVIPYEAGTRRDSHGPTDYPAHELREKARSAVVMTPHILPDGSHLTQRETALVLRMTGLSLLAPLACDTAAPDEGNMYLLGKVGSPDIKARFLEKLVSFHDRACRRGRCWARSLDDENAMPAKRHSLTDQ